MYKPFFAWEHRSSSGKPKSESRTTFLTGNRWDDSAAPSMLLSDSDDEVSVPDTYEHKPLHEQYEDELETVTDSRRQVRFGEACIREHPVIMDGHTACCDVWPLSLDWTYRDEKVYDIDDYELMRQRSGRRQRGRLSKLAAEERRRILEQAGMDTSGHYQKRNDTLSTADYPADSRKEHEPCASHDPVDVQDVARFDAPVEVLDEQANMCNPFAVLQDAGWCMCAFGGDMPAMKVEILED